MPAASALRPPVDFSNPPSTAIGDSTLLRFLTCGSVDDGKST